MLRFLWKKILCLGIVCCALAAPVWGEKKTETPAPVPSPVKDLREMAAERFPAAVLPDRTFKDPVNGVSFILPQGFAMEGIFTRGSTGRDVMMRAKKQDKLFVYSASGAKMQTETDGKTDTQPFRSRGLMLDMALKSYTEEAKTKGIKVMESRRGEFAGQPGIHVQQEEKDQLSDRYFFGDRKNLYSFSFMSPEKEFAALEPDIQKTLDSLKISTAYERVDIPGSGFSYEIPYGSVDIQKSTPEDDPHELMRLHLDEQMITGIIYQPLTKLPEYAVLPASLDGLTACDEENLARVMTQQREEKYYRKHPEGELLTNRTYFIKAAGRPCMVEETKTSGAVSKGYVFLDGGMLLSLDFEELGGKDQQAIIDHAVQSLRKNKEEGSQNGPAGI